MGPTTFAQRSRSRESVSAAMPYEVLIDSSRRGAFADLSDAIASAQIAKQEHPSASIAITDRATGQLVIQVDV
jgi:hypothetical protein